MQASSRLPVVASMAVDQEGDSAPKPSGAWFFKARPCKFIVAEDPCPFGDGCYYAHSRAELQPRAGGDDDDDDAAPSARHWRGRHVRIGVLEHALTWDLAPIGTVDIVCNRASCLGNPFAQRLYAPGEPKPYHDEDGWCPEEHSQVCAAFLEYLSAVLASAPGNTQRLFPLVRGLARKHAMEMAGSWLAQRLRYCDVQAALEGVLKRILEGERVRLLCHCRPHVKCHTEHLKEYLECQAASRESANGQEPGSGDDAEDPWPTLLPELVPACGPCCAGGRCRRVGRAMDPGDLRLYCSKCWLRQSEYLKNMGVALSFAPEAAEEIIEAYWENKRGGPADVEAPADAFGRCLFHLCGSCKFGSKCLFSHAPHEQVDDAMGAEDGRTPCRFFWRGLCKFGTECTFSHDRRWAPTPSQLAARRGAEGATSTPDSAAGVSGGA